MVVHYGYTVEVRYGPGKLHTQDQGSSRHLSWADSVWLVASRLADNVLHLASKLAHSVWQIARTLADGVLHIARALASGAWVHWL